MMSLVLLLVPYSCNFSLNLVNTRMESTSKKTLNSWLNVMIYQSELP